MKITEKNNPELYATLQKINWRYGRGDIVGVYLGTSELQIALGVPLSGTVKIQKQFGTELPQFVLSEDRRKVRFRGVTRVIRA